MHGPGKFGSTSNSAKARKHAERRTAPANRRAIPVPKAKPRGLAEAATRAGKPTGHLGG